MNPVETVNKSEAKKTVAPFPGVLETPGAIRTLLSAAEAEIRKLRLVGREGRQFLTEYGTKTESDELVKAAQRLRRCARLAKRFTILKRDESVTRKVKSSNGQSVSVPLVFHAKLPLKSVHSFEIGESHYRYDHVRVSAQSPVPTKEAVKAIKSYGKEFDHLEVWWVPNDILIEPLVKPDPVLVGYVGVSDTRGFYFQLHRWIDETVECAWFAKEGY